MNKQRGFTGIEIAIFVAFAAYTMIQMSIGVSKEEADKVRQEVYQEQHYTDEGHAETQQMLDEVMSK